MLIMDYVLVLYFFIPKSTLMLTKSVNNSNKLSVTSSFRIKLNDLYLQKTTYAKYLAFFINSLN